MLLLIGCIIVPAQTATVISASERDLYQHYFDNNKVSIHYSYIASSHIHSYSGNWDFDGDCEADSLYFISTGGAHEFFYLRIILSSDRKIRNFPFIQLDSPIAGTIKDLQAASFYPPPVFPQFVVDKFYSASEPYNLNDKIYIHFDHCFAASSEWKKRKVNSTYLLVQYKKGGMAIEDFIR